MPLTLAEQGALLHRLLPSSTTIHGEPVGEAILALTGEQLAELKALALRLERMAPHEDAIKRVVTGR